MTIYGMCGRCKKNKFLVRKRKYIFPPVSNKPIVSEDKLCGKCFRWIKEVTFAGIKTKSLSEEIK